MSLCLTIQHPFVTTRGREICSNLVRSQIMLFIEERYVSLFNNTTPLPAHLLQCFCLMTKFSVKINHWVKILMNTLYGA